MGFGGHPLYDPAKCDNIRLCRPHQARGKRQLLTTLTLNSLAEQWNDTEDVGRSCIPRGEIEIDRGLFSYQDRFRGFKSGRVHARRVLFLASKIVIGGKPESVR